MAKIVYIVIYRWFLFFFIFQIVSSLICSEKYYLFALIIE